MPPANTISGSWPRLCTPRACGIVTAPRLSTSRSPRCFATPFYTGIIKIKKTGESYQGNHEPIIPLQVFKRVQEVLTGKTHRKVIKHDFLFRQLFVCQPCQRCLVPEAQKSYIYYRCHGKGCPSSMQREERLESTVIHQLKQLEFSQDEKEYFRAKLLQMQQSWQGQQQMLIQGLELRVNQIQERFTRLTDAFLDQTIDKQTFEQRKTALLEERCVLQNQLTQLKSSVKPLSERLNELLELAGNAYLAYRAAVPEEKRELLKILSSNRTLDGKTLTIMLKLPYRLVAERANVFDGCPRRAQGLDVKSLWDELFPRLLQSLQLV
jgi:site-specific DNA recombinase